MFFIWTGWGLIVPLFFFLGIFASLGIQNLLDMVIVEKSLSAMVSIILSQIIFGSILFFLGKHMNREKETEFVHKDSGKLLLSENENKFFFIPIQYWGLVIMLGTIILNVLSYLKIL